MSGTENREESLSDKSPSDSQDESIDPTSCINCRGPEAHQLFNLWKSGGASLKQMLAYLAPSLPTNPGMKDETLWRTLMSVLEPPPRKRLAEYNSIEDAVELIKNSHNIMVLSGAGISTSAGIPDFRSRNGIYVQINSEYPDLEDPKLMFEINYFRKNPKPFYRFAKALFPGQYQPTIGHKFIRCIETHDKLLRNYSQNIDTLEKQANITRVIECHGSFAKATCTFCGYCIDGNLIEQDVMEQKVPLCPKCLETKNESNQEAGQQERFAVMKPNIVFFGEQLPVMFHDCLEHDRDALDLLIVIGSSLKVRPVAMIPQSVPAEVPQILINKEPLDHLNFDIELLGDCDEIIEELCLRLGEGWSDICRPGTTLMTEIDKLPKRNKEQDEVSIDSDGKRLKLEPESTEERPQMTEENQGDCDGKKMDNNNDDDDNEDDWTDDDDDIESSGTKLNYVEKVPVNVPRGNYIKAKPGRYLFHGAELTAHQLQKVDSRDLETSPPQASSSSLG